MGSWGGAPHRPLSRPGDILRHLPEPRCVGKEGSECGCGQGVRFGPLPLGGALLSESAGQLPAGPVRARVLPCVLVTAVAPRPSPWGVNKAIGREAHTMVSSASGRVSERRSCLCWDLEPPPLGGAPRQPWAEPSGGPGWGEWAERSYRQGPGQAGRSSDPGPGWVPGAQLLTGPTWGLPQCRALLGARAWLDPGRAQPWWFCGPVAGTPCAEGQCRPTRWRGHFRLAPALIRGLQALQNCDGCCWPPGHLGAHASPEGSPVCFLLFASACPCVPHPPPPREQLLPYGHSSRAFHLPNVQGRKSAHPKTFRPVPGAHPPCGRQGRRSASWP